MSLWRSFWDFVGLKRGQADSDFDEIMSRCKRLSHRQRVLFGLLRCERLYPNYLDFHKKEGWGNPEAIRDALDAAWQWLAGEPADKAALADHRQNLDSAAPDTEDFDTIDVSSALDAAVAAEALLELLLRNDADRLAEIVTSARDTVDMYVQGLENFEPMDPNLEQKINQHPLMQREFEQMRDDLHLFSATNLTCVEFARLREQRRNPRKSRIDLGA